MTTLTPTRQQRPTRSSRQPRAAAIAWPQRHRLQTWPATGLHRVWLSKCRQFRISRLVLPNLLGPYVACARQPAQPGQPAQWSLLARHRTLTAAQRACRLANPQNLANQNRQSK